MREGGGSWGQKSRVLTLPCLCVAAATLALVLGIVITPFVLGTSRQAIAINDLPQLTKPKNVMVGLTGVLPSLPTNQIVEPFPSRIAGSGHTPDGLLGETLLSGKNGSVLELHSDSDRMCNLFTGKWIPDPLGPVYHSGTCPIVTQSQNCPGNGRPDTGYENWRWKPTDCDIPRFDANAFLELMRGKTLAFVGDSVARNQYESLICMLWQVQIPRLKGNSKMQIWVFDSHSFRVIRLWSSWLVRTSEEAIDFAPANLTKLHLEELDNKIIEALPRFDVTVVSSGHWWPRKTAYILDGKVVGGQGWWTEGHVQEYDAMSGFAVAMKTAMKRIVSQPNYKGLTILRTYSPDHYEKGEWNTGGSCTGKTQPLTDKQLPQNKHTDMMLQHQLTAYKEALQIMEGKPSKLRLMDITSAFVYRADGHPGPYRNTDPNKITNRGPKGQPPPQDCLHWCMPGPVDTFNVFLFEMLKREFLS